mgnify:FL=1
MSTKKLFKSDTNKMLSGVCGGLAEYLGWDASLVRLGVVVLTLVTSFALVLVYIAAAIILPYKSQL